MDLKTLLDRLSAYPLLTILGFITIVLGANHVFWTVVESRVESYANDPEFLRKLAAKIRPTMVLDANGSVILDTGALTLLKSTPTITKNGNNWILEIDPITYLAQEPLVEALDARYVIEGNRSKSTTWRFDLKEISSLITEGSATPTRPERFRIEIITK